MAYESLTLQATQPARAIARPPSLPPSPQTHTRAMHANWRQRQGQRVPRQPHAPPMLDPLPKLRRATWPPMERAKGLTPPLRPLVAMQHPDYGRLQALRRRSTREYCRLATHQSLLARCANHCSLAPRPDRRHVDTLDARSPRRAHVLAHRYRRIGGMLLPGLLDRPHRLQWQSPILQHQHQDRLRPP